MDGRGYQGHFFLLLKRNEAQAFSLGACSLLDFSNCRSLLPLSPLKQRPRRLYDAELAPQLVERPRKLVLVVDAHQVDARPRVLRRPRQHVPCHRALLRRLEPQPAAGGRQRAHGQPRLRGLEPLERHLAEEEEHKVEAERAASPRRLGGRP